MGAMFSLWCCQLQRVYTQYYDLKVIVITFGHYGGSNNKGDIISRIDSKITALYVSNSYNYICFKIAHV